VLFSEPKIPQTAGVASSCNSRSPFQCSSASRKFLKKKGRQSYGNNLYRFSALQRAENSSKIPANFPLDNRRGFSALQRAENSSNPAEVFAHLDPQRFQCSSASRKFLKIAREAVAAGLDVRSFSALQRAENSSNRTATSQRCV